MLLVSGDKQAVDTVYSQLTNDNIRTLQLKIPFGFGSFELFILAVIACGTSEGCCISLYPGTVCDH